MSLSKKKSIILISIITIIFLSVFFFSRSSYVSDELKRLILPEIGLAFNKKVQADSVYLNILPLFIGINELRVYDDAGVEILQAKKIKGYIGFFELFNKTIAIKRLVIKEPTASFQKNNLDEILSSVQKQPKSQAQKPFSLIIKSVQISNGNISLRDERHTLSFTGMNSDIVIIGTPNIRLSSERVRLTKDKVFDIEGRTALNFILKNNNIDLKSLKFTIDNSEMKTTGFFDIGKSSGELQTEANLMIDSVKKMFGLINKGEGILSAKGSIKTKDLRAGWRDIYLDLNVSGNLYLETLMELLKVRERLEGKLTFDGTLKGQLGDIKGEANAELERGNLFDVDIDRLNCRVAYADRRMKFTEGKAVLYGGSADAEVIINLPVVDYFTLNVVARDVSSKGIFSLIRWDPNISEGKVSGVISSSGRVFNPDGDFIYKSMSAGKDILGRIKEIKGRFSMRDNFIRFSELSIINPKSNLNASGSVDLNNKRLNFTGSGSTLDLLDFTSPYFLSLSGAGKYNVSVHGDIPNPSIDIAFESDRLSFTTGNVGAKDVLKNRRFDLNSVKTTFTYNKNSLTLKELSGLHNNGVYTARGNIYFRKASKLFELKEPDYDLNIAIKNVDIHSISDTIYGFPEFSGLLRANFVMKGVPSDLRFAGDFHANEFYYQKKYMGDTLFGKFEYLKKEFLITSASISRGSSTLNFNSNISLDKKFVLKAEGKKIGIGDVIPISLVDKYKVGFLRELYLDNVVIKGSGTIENPYIDIKGNISGKNSRTGGFGKGNLDSKITGKEANINISMMDGRFKFAGKIGLDEKMQWSGNAEFKPANYAPFVAGFLKDLPDDLLLNITGSISAFGDKEKANLNLSLKRLHLYLYGVSLVNTSEILIDMKDNKILIGNFGMHGDDTELSLSGDLTLGKDYNLHVVGTSSVAPIKSLFKEIETVRGKAYFAASLTGAWDNPKIDGGIDLANGMLALKNIPYRMTSVSAYLYVDDNRIIVKNIDGKLAGGDVSAFGTIYLRGVEIKKFSFESRLKDLTISPSKELSSSIDGTLYYRGSLQSQELAGDVYIRKAKYTQRVEWKSWLLQARKTEIPKPDVTKLGLTALNIRVKGDNLVINNNVADTTAKMDLILRGTISKPVLVGKVNADKGLVYFRNNEFRVLKARIDFIDPEKTSPYFDIIAETRVRNYLIKLHLDGNFEHFDLALTSDPHLSDSDIFSLLTSGNIGKQMKGLEGGVGAGEASLFLAGKLQDVLEERVATITGLDRIQIDPQVSKTTGTVTPRLTVSKKIMGDKLLVTYSASVGTGEEQIWKLEYLLDKNTSFVLVRDERAALGGDIKFKFEFK